MIMKCLLLQNEGNIMNKEQNNNNNNEMTQDKKGSSKPNFWENVAKEHPISISIFCSIVASVIVSFVSSAITFPSRLDKIEKSLENFHADVNAEFATINSRLEKLESQYSSLESQYNRLESQYSSLEDRTKTLENNIFEVVKIQAYSNVISTIDTQFSSIKDENFVMDLLFTNKSDVIATDILTNTEYTVEQLADKRLLLTYEEEGNNVVFYGRFNENNHWDGNCIINVYNGDKLIAITDGLYNDGILLQYKQAFIDADLSGKEKWFVSSRVHTEEYNTGKTLQYDYTEHKKKFDFSNVALKDIVDVDSFISSLTSNVDSIYHGNTCNGQFNDDTGSAYYVSYDDSKSIKTLYVGNFKDGNFHDTTGKAWYITKAADTDYMYYIGKFEDGHPTEPETKDNFINPISLQQRNEIIKDKKFDCEIKWFDDDTSTL